MMKVPSVLFLLAFSLFIASSHAYIFYVGGREGWVLHPSESYADWAGRNRFQVNDTLVFEYTKGEDSVLEVSQQDFDQCNLNNPIQKMDSGFSVFIFNRSGPFFFVSGTDDRCKQGQKLIIVVMAVRAENPITPLPPLPPSMAPTISPVAPPTGSPAPSPSSVSPPMNSPVSTPSVSPAPSPFSVPPSMNSPVSTPTVSPAPSPFSVSPPALTPTSSSTGSPGSSPSTQPSAPGSPTTPNSPNTETSSNPTGAAPGFSDFRASSVSFALVVAILNYGMFN